ncbi:MAG: DNA topoisomerase IB [Chitinophagaceae bacterium]|nr:DNA topoisomerase IB [Oligoflexus sp.]
MSTLKRIPKVLKLTPEQEADIAGLSYLHSDAPGFVRKRVGKHFRYFDAKGKLVSDPKLKARFKALVIPPAWENVWISPDPRNHIQVTGRDERGRKQYRYHSLWRTQRDGTKFDKMLIFGKVLPKIRQEIKTNLNAKSLSKRQIVATVVHLLETTLIRVGNESYAKQNKSYGLTTIRDKHVEIDHGTLRFQFKGKSGVAHDVKVKDRRIAKIVERCHDLPGQLLFKYLDEAGELRPVGSTDINEFLRHVTGNPFTAKDFRTWCASVLAAKVLREFEPPTSMTRGNKNVKAAITEVAAALRNTVSVCKKCYVHPKVIEAYLDGMLDEKSARKYQRVMKSYIATGLGKDEAFLLALIEGCDTAKTRTKAA